MLLWKFHLNIEFCVLMTANTQNSLIYQNNRPSRLACLLHSGDKQFGILTRNSIILTLGFCLFLNFFQDYHYPYIDFYLSVIYTFFTGRWITTAVNSSSRNSRITYAKLKLGVQVLCLIWALFVSIDLWGLQELSYDLLSRTSRSFNCIIK